MEEIKDVTVVEESNGIDVAQHLSPLANERRIDMLFRLSAMLKVPDLNEIAAEPERFEKFNKTIFNLMVKKTDPRDWNDRNGFPELQSTGAYKIRAAFRMTIAPYYEPIVTSYTGIDGKQYRKAEVAGVFFHPQLGLHEEIGSRTTEGDDFVKNWPDTELKKCAVANFVTRGLPRLVGIQNLTWEILGAIDPKYTKTGAAKIEHTSGKKGGSVAAGRTEGEKNEARDLWAICMELGGQNPVAAMDALEKITTWTVPEGKENAGKVIKGVRDVNLIPGNSLRYKLTDAKKLYKETFGRPFTFKEVTDGNDNSDPYAAFDNKPANGIKPDREPGDDGLFPGK
jgi:hypothetical protein